MEEMAREIEPDLRALGRWLFPTELVDVLLEKMVTHIVVVPDFRLFSIPWGALYDGTGEQLIDRGWLITQVPTALHLYELLVGHDAAGVSVFAPKEDVNVNMGGTHEVESVVASFPAARVHTDAAATSAELNAALGRGEWVHVRSHGTRHEDAYVPALYDGPWSPAADANAGRGAYLAAACCRTGATSSAGQEVLGLVESLLSAGVTGTLLPVVSVEGLSTAAYMREFYAALACGGDVSESQQRAALAMRARFVHPLFWSAFICIGDWNRRPSR